MVDYVGTLYHVGVRVVDLEAAMAELGAALGITWASVVEREQPAWTPADGAFTPTVSVLIMLRSKVECKDRCPGPGVTSGQGSTGAPRPARRPRVRVR